MSTRNIWSGNLRIAGLHLSIKLAPVAVEPKEATQYACPEHDADVEQLFRCAEGSELLRITGDGPTVVRGFKVGDTLVKFTKEDLEALETEQDHILDVLETRSVWGFPLAMLDAPYRVSVKPGSEAGYAAFCRALDRRRRIAIGKMVMNGRVKLVALVPNGSLKALTVFTLRRDIEGSEAVSAPATMPNLKTMMALVDGLEVKRNIPVGIGVEDTYSDRLHTLMERLGAEVSAQQLEASVNG